MPNLSLSNKIIIFFASTLLFALLSIIVYQQFQMSKRQQAIESQIISQKELIDNITRSQSQYSSKEDINNLIKSNNLNLKAIQDDLDKLHAEISAVNIISAVSHSQSGSNIPSTSTGHINPNPSNTDPYGYMKNEQKLALHEQFDNTKVPFGEVGFSAWQEKPWNFNIFQREYKVVNVIGTDENQRNYVYNKFSVNVNNKDYDIHISNAQVQQEFPSPHFSWWNPRLHMTTGGSINLAQSPLQGSLNLGVTMSIASYGQFKTNPTLNFLQVGAGYQTGTQNPSLILNPVNLNIGGALPKGLVNSTYLGPSLQLDTGGNVLTGVNLSVGL